MSEQRMKILEMLESGTISVQEAQSLLQAVSDGVSPEGEGEHPEPLFDPYQGVESEPKKTHMVEIDLSTVTLEGTNLHDANLIGAKLDGTDLTGANLNGANLENADLQGANLAGTNLRGANLKNAILTNAELTGSNLPGADFEGVHYPELRLVAVNLPNFKFRGTPDQGAKVMIETKIDEPVIVTPNIEQVVTFVKAEPHPQPHPEPKIGGE